MLDVYSQNIRLYYPGAVFYLGTVTVNQPLGMY